MYSLLQHYTIILIGTNILGSEQIGCNWSVTQRLLTFDESTSYGGRNDLLNWRQTGSGDEMTRNHLITA
jgi:RAB protein geranylgeranyltransferase component A